MTERNLRSWIRTREIDDIDDEDKERPKASVQSQGPNLQDTETKDTQAQTHNTGPTEVISDPEENELDYEAIG